MATPEASRPLDFVRQIVADDLAAGKYSRVMTRFPPGAQRLPAHRPRQVHLPQFRHRPGVRRACATCASTTPTPPRKRWSTWTPSWHDVRWLGFDWDERLFYASDYFEQMYDYAVHLIKEGKAFVCDLTAEEVREYRGTLTEPGKESPYRNRSVEPRTWTCSPHAGRRVP